MKRLYKMTCTINSFFVAEDNQHLFLSAVRCWRGEIDYRAPTSHELKYQEIASIEELGEDSKTIPWFNEGKTCAQFLVNASKSCDGKVVEIDGHKYKLIEVK